MPGNHSEFESAVNWVSENLDFDVDVVVSVFETNIRVLGAPLSTLLASSNAHPLPQAACSPRT